MQLLEILKESLPSLTTGILVTIRISIISLILAFILGIILGIFTISKSKILNAISTVYIYIIRGTPLLVQLFIIFYGLPKIGVILAPLPSAIIGFTMNMGAYNSEVIRAAIISIAKGQWEAAYSIGMTKRQALDRIILPQAARVSIPPLFNSFISLVKDTSLAASITLTEMFQVAQRITAATYEPLVLYCEAAFIYLMFCTVLTFMQGWIEHRLDKYVAK